MGTKVRLFSETHHKKIKKTARNDVIMCVLRITMLICGLFPVFDVFVPRAYIYLYGA